MTLPLTVLELEQDSLVTVGNEAPVLKKRGEKMEVDNNSPIILQAAGRTSMMVLPVGSVARELKVTLTPNERSAKERAAEEQTLSEQKLEALIEEIVPELNEIQVFLSSGKEDKAVAKITSLETKYPRLSHLKFLKASALMLQGDWAKARETLELGLKLAPHHLAGQKLYESLSEENNQRKTNQKKRFNEGTYK